MGEIGDISIGLLSQDDKFDLNLYQPAYQLPNLSLDFYNNNYERIAYSIFCSHFAKLGNLCVIIDTKYRKYEFKGAKIEIDELYIKANKIYNNAKLSLEYIMNLIPEHKIDIKVCLHLLKCSHITCVLCIYNRILDISNNSNLSIIQAILDMCIELWSLFSSNIYLIDLWNWSPYFVSFNLIHIYSLCSPSQQKVILSVLKSIVNLYSKEGFDRNSMNFLILYTQFNLINS
jgi:hypothetical protein